VQGGGPPGATTGPVSKPLVEVDTATGNVTIQRKTLNVSDLEHAEYFQATKRPGGTIVSFEIPKWLDDFIREYTIPQRGYRTNPANQGRMAPKRVDPRQPGFSLELPPIWVEWINEYLIPGSGRVRPPR
jgi:hypothetical protein